MNKKDIREIGQVLILMKNEKVTTIDDATILQASFFNH
jgi:hypothetical protein